MNQHGTALEWNGIGLLLIGPPGCGKSELAYTLMQHGAELVADDQVLLAGLTATCPPLIRGKIHLREIGILTVPARPSTTLRIILQSLLPADKLSTAPALGLPVIIVNFKADNIVTLVENALSSISPGFTPAA